MSSPFFAYIGKDGRCRANSRAYCNYYAGLCLNREGKPNPEHSQFIFDFLTIFDFDKIDLFLSEYIENLSPKKKVKAIANLRRSVKRMIRRVLYEVRNGEVSTPMELYKVLKGHKKAGHFIRWCEERQQGIPL